MRQNVVMTSESFVANIASEIFLARVRFQVQTQRLRFRKFCIANIARKFSLIRVRREVRFEAIFGGKSRRTKIALERFDTEMSKKMFLQILQM